MSLRTIRILGIALLACSCSLSVDAAQDAGKISGVVLDAGGAPQMGATVVISSEKLFGTNAVELLTNDGGRFAAPTLSPGLYSVKVTLAGFMPSVEQHIQVTGEHTTVLQIVLGSALASFEKLRRQPDQQLPGDEWSWVLRGDSATRPVLRWQDGEVILDQASSSTDQPHVDHARLEFTSGSEHPGSVSNLADSPSTGFAYDMGIGARSKLLMAGQFSYDGTSPAGGLAAEWVPTGDINAGPVTSLVVRESRLGPDGPTFRGLRFAHDDQIALGDRVSIRYGAEALVAGINNNAVALRPRAEVVYKVSPSWQAFVMIASRPWDDGPSQNELQSALNTLDAFPTLLLRNGRSVLASDLHEEAGVEHEISDKSDVHIAVFHDRSSHTAVFGRGAVSGNDYLQDFFSDVFAYDGGATGSIGTRVAYRRKLTGNIETTLMYEYAGALAPGEEGPNQALRSELTTRYRQAVAGRISARVPRLGTKVMSSYKWIGGAALSPVDAFGESIYHIDPFLSMEVRQPLPSFIPGHMVVIADVGNLLAQGYVPITTSDGRVVLVPTYRFFRGGLSIQF